MHWNQLGWCFRVRFLVFSILHVFLNERTNRDFVKDVLGYRYHSSGYAFSEMPIFIFFSFKKTFSRDLGNFRSWNLWMIAILDEKFGFVWRAMWFLSLETLKICTMELSFFLQFYGAAHSCLLISTMTDLHSAFQKHESLCLKGFFHLEARVSFKKISRRLNHPYRGM